MNSKMLSTELYKIFSKKIIWISMVAVIILFGILNLQLKNSVTINYTLEPVRAELANDVQNEEFHDYIRSNNYECDFEQIKPYLSQNVLNYIEEYKEQQRIYNSLSYNLRMIVNNYFERIDARSDYINELRDSSSDSSSIQKAKMKLLKEYENTPVDIELNLEKITNNFIDVNHTAVFSGLIMLIIIVGLAGIFSDEYTSGTQAALLTSRNGRNGVFFSKLCALAIYVCFVVAIMETAYMSITVFCYGIPQTTISAASTFGMSLTLYNGSFYGVCVRQILGTMLAGLTLGIIVMCISAYSKNTLIPFFAAGVFYGGTALYANALNIPDYLSSFASLLGELSLFSLQTQVELISKEHYTNVLGILIPTSMFNVIFNIAVIIVFTFISRREYTRKQVKN